MLPAGILVTVMLALAFPKGSAFTLERGLATIGPERLAANSLDAETLAAVCPAESICDPRLAAKAP